MSWLDELRRIVRQYIDPQRYDWRPTVDPIPSGQAQIIATYGRPPVWDGQRKKWVEGFHGVVLSASRIPGYDRRLYIHKLVAPHFCEAMRLAVDACPDYRFRRIGCYNPRKKRHSTDPDAEWSTHAWGIALDINPDTNRAGTTGDLPEGVVNAFERVGFRWGGRWKRRDPMHFQLARGY